MGTLWELRPGHIHMGTSISGAVARIWPTADPDLWHLGCACYPPHATEQPVPSSEIAAMLEEWGFEAERWTSWPGPVHQVNRDLAMVRRSPTVD